MFRVAALCFLGGLVACMTTTPHHVDEAEVALGRGQLEAAERAYQRAVADEQLSRTPDPWVMAKVKAGRARIELARIRRAEAWRDRGGTTLDTLARLHALRDRVRTLGGDEAIERDVIAAMKAAAAAELIGLAAAPLPPFERLRRARELARYPELTPETRANVASIAAATAAFHRDLATRARGFPLTARVHAALAASASGEALPADPAAARYRRRLVVTTRGASCAAVALPTTGDGGRVVEVEVAFDACADRSVVERATREETYEEQVHVRTEPASEQKGFTCMSGGNPCTKYDVGYMPGCRCYETLTKFPAKKIYETQRRKEQRAIERQTGDYELRGTCVVRRGAIANRIPFAQSARATGERGVATERYRAFEERWSSAAAFFATAGAELAARIDRDAQRLLDDERAGIEEGVRAKERAGAVAEADEGWLEIALMGGALEGRWASWGVAASDLAWAFAAVGPSPAPPHPVAARAIYAVPPRPDLTERERAVHDAAIWPTLGLHGGRTTLPAVAPASVPTLIGDRSALVVGLDLSAALFGSSRVSTDGLGYLDVAAVEAELGYITAQRAGAEGRLSWQLGAAYTGGVGYRVRGRFGVLAGLRAEASYTRLGGDAGTTAAVTPIGRVELWLGLVRLAADGFGATLAGDRVRGVNLHLGIPRRDGFTRWLSVRYERRALDATLAVDPSVELDVSDVDVSRILIMLGLGA